MTTNKNIISTAIIDNASISSALRALGFVQCPNKSVFDLDIACLDNLVFAVLFSDKVKVPDIYQEEFRAERKMILDEAGIETFTVHQEDMNFIEKLSKKQLQKWALDYKCDGNGNFQNILKLMNIYLDFVWNHRSSYYQLVYRAFECKKMTTNKHLPALDALFNIGNKVKFKSLKLVKNAELYDNNNNLISNENSSFKTKHDFRLGGKPYIASLAWTIHRAIFYRILSAKYSSTYIPHHLRSIGCALDSCCASDKLINSLTIDQYGFNKSGKLIIESLQNIASESQSVLASVGAIEAAVIPELPPLLFYLLSKSNTREDFIQNLCQLKNDKRIIELRSNLRNFENAVKNNNFDQINKFKNNINNASNMIKTEFGITPNIFSFNPSALLKGGQIDNLFVKQIPSFLNKSVFLNPNDWRIWYKEVAFSLQNVAQLGKNHEKITSWANFNNNDYLGWYNKKGYPDNFTKLLQDGVE